MGRVGIVAFTVDDHRSLHEFALCERVGFVCHFYTVDEDVAVSERLTGALTGDFKARF